MEESKYQRLLIDRINSRFPGCVIIVNNPARRQGIPDLIILYGDRWAALEVKASDRSPKMPNQAHWVDRLEQMSFAAFIFPENEGVVLDELQRSFFS